jgi:hypothetical protein
MLTVTQLRAERVAVAHLGTMRAVPLAVGLLWSGSLGARIVLASTAPPVQRRAALALFAVPLLLLGGTWYVVFWRW